MSDSCEMNDPSPTIPQTLIDRLVETGNVVAIALGGSQACGSAAEGSDMDLYVLTSTRIDPTIRREIIEPLADDPYRIDIGIQYWGDEDAFSINGTWYDLAFFDAAWFFDQIDAVLTDHRVSQGYSTSFVYTLDNMVLVHDPEDQLAAWKRRTAWYPDDLAEAIIAHNYSVACTLHSSYRNQIARAVQLNDPVAVNHRVAAFLACVFDITFASLRMWHPGEKRQLQHLQARAASLPADFDRHIRAVLEATTPPRMFELMPAVDEVVDSITRMVEV